MTILETLKQFWRPTLAISLLAIMLNHFILAPIFGYTTPDLPDQYWLLFTAFCSVYGAGRSWEKTKTP